MVSIYDLPENLRQELIMSEEDIQMLEEAKKRPIVFDEDCPEVTPEMAIKFRRIHAPRPRMTNPA